MKYAGVLFFCGVANTVGFLCFAFGVFFKTDHLFSPLNRIHGTESCDFKKMKSLVKWYIPNLIFSGHSHLELRYILPLENVNKFPGNVY